MEGCAGVGPGAGSRGQRMWRVVQGWGREPGVGDSVCGGLCRGGAGSRE